MRAKTTLCILSLFVCVFCGCYGPIDTDNPSESVSGPKIEESIVSEPVKAENKDVDSEQDNIDAAFRLEENYGIDPSVDLEKYYLEDDDIPLFPTKDAETGLFGYINNKGEWVIEPRFYFVGTFKGGLAGVKLKYKREDYSLPENVRLSALINKRGEVVFELPDGFTFNRQFIVTDRLIPIETKLPVHSRNEILIWYTAFIDLHGNIVIPLCPYNRISSFSERLAYHSPSHGYLDTQGNLALKIPDECDWAGEFHDGLAQARIQDGSNYRYGYINKKGEWAIEPAFDSLRPFSNGVAAVRLGDELDGLWGLIDQNGNWVLEPSLDEIITGEYGNQDNLFSAKTDGKWGSIDHTGLWVIKPQFSNRLEFFEGLSRATVEFYDFGIFRSDSVSIDRDPRRYGYIDQSGNWVIEPDFVCACPFRNGLTFVANDEDMIGGFIDKSGNWVWNSDFVLIHPFSDQVDTAHASPYKHVIDVAIINSHTLI